MSESKSICCPSCGEWKGLHHSDIEIFPRPAEDGKYGSVVVHSDGSVTEGNGSNPSGRRQGLRISLWCEHCGEQTALCLAQHKGTELLWGEKYTAAEVSVVFA